MRFLKYFSEKQFVFLSIVIFLISFILLVKQLRTLSDFCDFQQHLTFIEKYKGYSLLHHSINFICLFLPYKPGIYLIIVLLFTIYFMFVLLKNYFSNLSNLESNFYAFSAMFVSMLLFDPNFDILLSGMSGSIWFNPTYIFCKPFSFLVFIYFIQFINSDDFRKNNNLILFSILCLLCMWAKPSFLLSFIPTMFVFLTYQYFNKKVNFSFLFKFAFSVCTSILPLLFIYSFVYIHKNLNENHIYLAYGEVFNYFANHNIIWNIIVSITFPIYVFIFFNSKLTNTFYVSLLNYIFAFSIFYMLGEDGDRKFHGNFSWTYLYSIFFLFIASIEVFAKNYKNSILHIIGLVLYNFHFISGLYYVYFVNNIL